MTGRARVDLAARTAVSRRPPVYVTTVRAGGGSALAASAIVQGALGIEFALSGLNKAADPAYLANFTSFVRANPGSTIGPLSPLVQALVLPNAGLFSALLEATELALGLALVLA